MFDTPLHIIQLYQTIKPSHFNRINSIRLVFCSNYASSRLSEFNKETFEAALKILRQMPNLQSFNITITYKCWRDHFFLKAYPYGNHPYTREIEDPRIFHKSYLTPPAWFETPGECVWLREAPVEFKLEDILPYLYWVRTEVPCRDVVVQLHGMPKLYPRSLGNSVIVTRTMEVRLKSGIFIKS